MNKQEFRNQAALRLLTEIMSIDSCITGRCDKTDAEVSHQIVSAVSIASKLTAKLFPERVKTGTYVELSSKDVIQTGDECSSKGSDDWQPIIEHYHGVKIEGMYRLLGADYCYRRPVTKEESTFENYPMVDDYLEIMEDDTIIIPGDQCLIGTQLDMGWRDAASLGMTSYTASAVRRLWGETAVLFRRPIKKEST